MQPILHHLGFDLRKHALLLGAWSILVGIHVFLSGSGLVEKHAAPGADVSSLLNIFVAAVSFLPLLLVLIVVHADAPVDEDAFWVTRPVRGPALFVSKLLLVCSFFIVLPLAGELAILALRGAGAARVGMAVPEFLLVRGALVLVAFGAGSLAARLFQGMGFLGGLAIAVPGALIGMFLVLNTDAIPRGQHLFPSRLLVAGLLFGAGGLAAAGAMYWVRRQEMGMVILFPAAALGGCAAFFWPVDLIGFGAPREAAASMEDFRVTYDAGSPVQLTRHNQIGRGGQSALLSVEVETAGARRDGVARIMSVEAMFRPEADSRAPLSLTDSADFIPNRTGSFRAETREAVHRLFPGYEFGTGGASAPGDEGSTTIRFPGRLSGERLESFRESATCEVSLQGKAGWFALEVAGELPLREGARWTGRGEEVKITAIPSDPSRLRLVLETREIRQMFDRERLAVSRGSAPPWAFVVVHPGRMQAVEAHAEAVRGLPVFKGFSPLAGARLRFVLDLPTEPGRTPTAEDVGSWFAEGRLIILQPVFRGAVDWSVAPATHPLIDLHHSL
ncbi:hypothetical protein BH23VER1_BH23VER1_05820 [soil metagenome]